MDRWQNRVAVVTGASSGIGAAIVKDLLKQGLVVAALARRKERVDEYRQKLPADQQKRLYAIRTDVTSQESVNEAFDTINKQLGGVDILISNAGAYVQGQLSSMDLKDVEQTVLVNVLGVIYAIQRAVKSLKERNAEGHVVVINSILGHNIPNPPIGQQTQLNVYPATKYAVTAIAEVLRQEFVGAGGKIRITSVSPGLTDTEILPEQLKVSAKNLLQPEDVSSVVLFALSTPSNVQITEVAVRSTQAL